MTSSYVSDNRDAEPVSLAAAVSGHLFMAVLKAPVAFVLLWLTTLVPAVGHFDVSSLVGATIATYLVGELLAVAAERPFVLSAGRPSPGGWGFALAGWWMTPVVGLVVGWLILDKSGAAAVATFVAVAAPATVEALLGAPWERGESREEFHQRYVKFKDMTKETFAADVAEVKQRARDKARDDYYRKR